jgi:hypothetical protein
MFVWEEIAMLNASWNKYKIITPKITYKTLPQK